ncbi:carbohydrate sulfotransferase 4 isoform X1 [Rhipicephalus microplus]|uniref:carbohydrate sulfotransferase 4 isoform X1 n=1 Tax=Rhipicephalus microplus TaxID=6941 RepID=UPI003F6B7966
MKVLSSLRRHLKLRAPQRQRTCIVLFAAATFLLFCGVICVYDWRTYKLSKCCQELQSDKIIVERPGSEGLQSIPLNVIGTPEGPRVVNKRMNPSAACSDSSLEVPLPAAFESALEKYAIVPSAGVKVVIIIAYYRSGSTFFGELLSSAPRTFFHFEPLMMFTVSGGIRPGRECHAFQLLDGLVRCHFDPLYTVWLENNPYYKYNHFLADICERGQSCSSPGHLSALCSRAATQVFKFTRLRARQVASWIEQNQNIAETVRVVHLVRDPRAIYSSRRGLRWCTEYEYCGSASALCDQMRSDLNAFVEISGKLQKDRTYQIRFEDLTADPVNETLRLFEWLDLDFARSVTKYLEEHTSATAADVRDAHSTRRNTRLVAYSWKSKLLSRTIREIEVACSDVLQRLGYDESSTSMDGVNA